MPSVIQSVTPFMSASDIEKGSRWNSVLANHLEDAQFGLICLTQENLEAPWLLFEAGALSKSLENSRVVPYLYGVSQTDLQGPLALFQGAVADENSTLDVIKSINAALEGDGLDPARLEGAFETWWPQLEKALDNIPKATAKAPPSRSDRDILEEVLRLTRQMSRQRARNFAGDVWSSPPRPWVAKEGELSAGDRVKHGTFGEGIVVSCAASGDDQLVTVAFKGTHGIKRLLQSYAPLEKLP